MLLQVFHMRRSDLGAFARCQGAAAGTQVSDRHVDLMSNGGNDGNFRFKDGPGYDLGIERRQVFVAAAAAPEENDVDAGVPIEMPERVRDLGRGFGSLNANGANPNLGARP